MSDLVIMPWLDKAPKYSISVIPPMLVFARIDIGESSERQTVSLSNEGYADLQISKLHAHRDFVFSPVGDSSVIRAGKTLKVEVFHRPTTESFEDAAVLKVDFGCGIPLSVAVPLSVSA